MQTTWVKQVVMDALSIGVALKFFEGHGSTLSPQEILTIRVGLDQLKYDSKFGKAIVVVDPTLLSFPTGTLLRAHLWS